MPFYVLGETLSYILTWFSFFDEGRLTIGYFFSFFSGILWTISLNILWLNVIEISLEFYASSNALQ